MVFYHKYSRKEYFVWITQWCLLPHYYMREWSMWQKSSHYSFNIVNLKTLFEKDLPGLHLSPLWSPFLIPSFTSRNHAVLPESRPGYLLKYKKQYWTKLNFFQNENTETHKSHVIMWWVHYGHLEQKAVLKKNKASGGRMWTSFVKYSPVIIQFLLTPFHSFQMQAGSLEYMAICGTHQLNWWDPA